MKNAATLITFLFCLFLNTFGQSKTVTKEEVQPDEYSVYKAVLESLLKDPTTKQLVIRKFTSGSAVENSCLCGDRKTVLLKAFELETLEDYNLRHYKPFELKNNFGVDIPVNLVTDEELKLIFDKEKEKDLTETASQAMEKRYQSKMLITFSRVSFDKSSPSALVHVEYICGLSCSRGFIYILSKRDNRWSIVDSLHTRMPYVDYH
jgi:hypothetical protein